MLPSTRGHFIESEKIKKKRNQTKWIKTKEIARRNRRKKIKMECVKGKRKHESLPSTDWLCLGTKWMQWIKDVISRTDKDDLASISFVVSALNGAFFIFLHQQFHIASNALSVYTLNWMLLQLDAILLIYILSLYSSLLPLD